MQTPVHGGAGLRVGDRVWMRHAKAGELCERFNELELVRGRAIVDTVPTYRGEGKAFSRAAGDLQLAADDLAALSPW